MFTTYQLVILISSIHSISVFCHKKTTHHLGIIVTIIPTGTPKKIPSAVVVAQGAPRIGSVVFNPYITPIISYIYICIRIYKCGYSIYIHILGGITIYNPFTKWDAPASSRIVKSNQSFTQLPSLERRALSSASRPGCLSFPTPKF